MNRSCSLPAINSMFKTKGVVKFFSRIKSLDSESSSSLESMNFSKERKTYSVFETTDDDRKTPRQVSKLHLHPKARFSTKLPPHAQKPETWKQRFRRVFHGITE
ncbi:hypothetical protein CDAR_175491 [Caerostris darwini]|uniref:Uncharacterized protein n=1 Tax=Caerostris darwini TaxID=1538125 RepID=A0AAV4SCN3_9ARAC|nr:hypothetical protein CDAR_175491 [Caerostris darwini]